MKNIYAHTETGTISSYPGYISINEGTPTENNRYFEVSVREDTGGGFKPAFARAWLSREELQKMSDDINVYLNPNQDTPTAAAQQDAQPSKCGMSQAFPERDLNKPAEQQGIFRKFDVRRVDGGDQPGGRHYGCRYFVLDMDHDIHAPTALRAYANACAESHPKLAADLQNEFGSQADKSAEQHDIERAIETSAQRNY